MASLGINKCDRCGLEIRVEYGVGYEGGSPQDPETKIVRRDFLAGLAIGIFVGFFIGWFARVAWWLLFKP